MMKLWKGLHMCMWHSDKPLVQVSAVTSPVLLYIVSSCTVDCTVEPLGPDISLIKRLLLSYLTENDFWDLGECNLYEGL